MPSQWQPETTPLLLLALAWTAMHYIAKDWTLIGSLMATQVIIVVSGLIGAASPQQQGTITGSGALTGTGGGSSAC